MSLLDQLNAEPKLNMIHCCNELNAGEKSIDILLSLSQRTVPM